MMDSSLLSLSSFNMAPRQQLIPNSFTSSILGLESLKEINNEKMTLLHKVSPDVVSVSSDESEQKRDRDPSSDKLESAPKRIKESLETVASSRSALHKACRRGPNLTLSEVEEILARDPSAAYRPVRLTTTKDVYNPVTYKMEPKVVREPYKAPSNVLERLISAAPPALSLRDNNSCSLHILLHHKTTDSSTVDVMLLSRPEAASWKDNQMNTALHVAVRKCARLNSIRHMVTVYPDALESRNKLGFTPLDCALRHISLCSNEVVDFLRDQCKVEDF